MSGDPDDKLDLTVTPGGSRDAQMRAGVRTVNAKPMLIVGALVLAVTVLIGSIMMGRQTPTGNKGAGPAPQSQKTSAMQLASSVVGDAKDGTEVARAGAAPDAALAQSGPAAASAPGDLDTPPLPASVPAGSPDANGPLLRPGQTSPASTAARDGDRQYDQRAQDVQAQRTAAFLGALKASPKASAGSSGGLLQKVQDALPQPAATLSTIASAGTAGPGGGGLTDQEKLAALQQLISRQAAQGIEPSAAAKAEYARLTGTPAPPTSRPPAWRPSRVTPAMPRRIMDLRSSRYWLSMTALIPSVSRFTSPSTGVMMRTPAKVSRLRTEARSSSSRPMRLIVSAMTTSKRPARASSKRSNSPSRPCSEAPETARSA